MVSEFGVREIGRPMSLEKQAKMPASGTMQLGFSNKKLFFSGIGFFNGHAFK